VEELAQQVMDAISPTEEALVRMGAFKLHMLSQPGGVSVQLLDSDAPPKVVRVLVALPPVSGELASLLFAELGSCTWTVRPGSP